MRAHACEIQPTPASPHHTTRRAAAHDIQRRERQTRVGVIHFRIISLSIHARAQTPTSERVCVCECVAQFVRRNIAKKKKNNNAERHQSAVYITTINTAVVIVCTIKSIGQCTCTHTHTHIPTSLICAPSQRLCSSTRRVAAECFGVFVT